MNLFKIMCNGILHNFYSWIIKLCVFFKTHSAVYKYLYHKKKKKDISGMKNCSYHTLNVLFKYLNIYT